MRLLAGLLVIVFVLGFIVNLYDHAGRLESEVRIYRNEVAEMQNARHSLEQEIEDLKQFRRVATDVIATNNSALLLELQFGQGTLKWRLDMLEEKLTNRPPLKYVFTTNAALAHASAEAQSGKLKDGIPQNIHAEITAEAQRHWPRDYEMQDYQIRNQIEAYKKLHP